MYIAGPKNQRKSSLLWFLYVDEVEGSSSLGTRNGKCQCKRVVGNDGFHRTRKAWKRIDELDR